MTRRAGICLALAAVVVSGTVVASGFSRTSQSLQSDLDRIFSDPLLARAIIGARVESLRDGRLVYAQNDQKLVMPASNMKALTLAVAAERLGWDYTFDTRLDATGDVSGGILHGDLVVSGTGDPSIGAAASPFGEWAGLLADAGIRRIEGRIIGDDNAFDDDGIGPGWSWDDLVTYYAAPTGGLSYNENAVSLRMTPGATAGASVATDITPAGHGLTLNNQLKTGAAGSAVSVSLDRIAGQLTLTARGTLPAGGAATNRSASVDNPTQFFVEGLRLALIARGITVTGGAWDIDDVIDAPPGPARRPIARHTSPPLSSIAGYFMKVSQNFYAETVVKALGRAAAGAGTHEAGRRIVRETLAAWGVPAEAVVVVDGSGLSRYNYVTASTMVTVFRRMWQDERMRGAFAASLPVAGHDGTLDTRMRGTFLDAHVQAKTGTISNVRALSGYLETRSGHRLVFSIIVNHYTAPTAQIDAIVERALARLAED